MVIWGFLSLGVSPSHSKLDNFSIETNGFGGTPIGEKNICIYIYIMWTVESLFRICCLVNYSKSCVAVSSVSRKHGGELRSFFFAALGSWAKHCVWQKVPWNTMGIIYTVIPYSPHLHPPCSVLYGFTEHEGWELINFTLMYMCPN